MCIWKERVDQPIDRENVAWCNEQNLKKVPRFALFRDHHSIKNDLERAEYSQTYASR